MTMHPCSLILLAFMLFLTAIPALGQESRAQAELDAAVKQAETLRKAGNLDKAIAEYRRAIELAARAYGSQGDLRTVDLLNNLALLYRAKGQLKPVEFLYERALQIREAKLPAGHSRIAESLDNLAGHWGRSAQYDRAVELYGKSLKIYEGKKDFVQVARVTTNLAAIHSAKGDYARAEEVYRQALRQRQQHLGDTHPEVAASRNNLGEIFDRTGRHEEAEAEYRRALAILETARGKDDPLVAGTLSNLAMLHKAKGELHEAEPLLQRSVAILEARRGPNHPDVALVLNNQALVARAMGQLERARNLYERSLRIRKAALGDDHPDVAQTLVNLANLNSDLDRLGDAEALYRTSLQIRENRLGDAHPEVAAVRNNLGNLLARRGRNDEALGLLESCLAVRKERLGPAHPEVAQTLNDLARVRRARGDLDQAATLYEQSLQIFDASLDADHHHLAQARSNYALLQVSRGEHAAAARLTDQARHIVRRHLARVLPGLAEPEQLLFLENQYQPALHTALSLGLDRAGNEGIAELSAAWAVNGKAVAQQALAEPMLAARDGKDPKLANDARLLRSVRSQLAALSLIGPPRGEEAKHRQQLLQLAAHEQALAKKLGRAAASRGDPWVELREVRKALPEDTVLIEIARFRLRDLTANAANPVWKDEHYAAWVVRPAGAVQVIDLGDATAIDDAVQAAYESLKAAPKEARRRGEAASEQRARKLLAVLARLVLHPLLPHIDQERHWVIGADSSLWLVPWAALPLPNGPYALEKYRISYVLSGRDLLAPAAAGPLNPPVVMADPDYDLSPAAPRGGPGALRDTLAGISRVDRLPGTEAEERAITPLLRAYTGTNPDVYRREKALERAFKQVQRPQVLALCTHGYFLDGTTRTNPLLRCGLLFAGCNRRNERGPGEEDGVLTGLEIVGSDLRGTELVVLSACETALGQVRGGEGVAGLRQAFQLAGARNVVATLWQIPDEETVPLTTAFFKGLAAKKGHAEALRSAQLELLEARRARRGAAHPFFWAAFTLTQQGS